MKLVKHCNPEHNIKIGSALKLGTLYGYRHIENEVLRDEEEGTFVFTVSFPEEYEISKKLANLLMGGVMHFEGAETLQLPGSTDVEIERFFIVKQKPDAIVIKDSHFKIHRSTRNSFIFCMSIENEEAEKPFNIYKDRWSIDKNNADDLALGLTKLIFHQAKIFQLDANIANINSLSAFRTMQLVCQHKPVIYQDRHIIYNKDNILNYEDLVDILSSLSFIKSKKYSSDKEYRFVFQTMNNLTTYSPDKIDIFLETHALGDVLDLII